MNYSYDNGQYIIFDENKTDKPQLDWFEPAYWQNQNLVLGQAQGRGQALFVRYQTQEWVLRHYQRGGLVQKFNKDCYSWWGLKNTRMYREFSILRFLMQKGVTVPMPIAARVCRHGLGYRGDLITERIADSQDLASYLAQKSLSEQLWLRLGQKIAALHAAGIRHPDLNVRNVLVVRDTDYAFIDFDPSMAFSYRANMQRFLRSLNKLKRHNPSAYFTEKNWKTLCAGYAQCAL